MGAGGCPEGGVTLVQSQVTERGMSRVVRLGPELSG